MPVYKSQGQTVNFISRLLGGTRDIWIRVKLDSPLSRLYGGIPLSAIVRRALGFISRLFGGIQQNSDSKP